MKQNLPRLSLFAALFALALLALWAFRDAPTAGADPYYTDPYLGVLDLRAAALTATTGTVATLGSTTATVGTLNATTGTVATLGSTTATVGTLNATTGTVATLGSTTATVGTCNVTTGTLTRANATTLVATTGTVATLGSTTATVGTLNATTGTVTTLGSTTATLGTLNATTAAASTLAIGSGTTINALQFGSVSIGASETTKSLTLSGVTSSSRVAATITSGNTSSRHIVKAEPGTGTVLVTLSGTPGATTTVSILAVR